MTRGIVVCVHHRAAEEGAKALEAGGNAFDAAVATAFVQMVLLPFSCGVGGTVSAHLFARAKGEHSVIDGRLRAGSLATEDMWADDYMGEAAGVGTSLFKDLRSDMGYTSICTPGTVAALAELHQRYCTMSWRELIGPAIRITRDGFAITPYFRVSMASPSPSPYQPDWPTRLQATAACAKLYLNPDGSIFEEGHTIRNPDYADTLEHLARKGAEDFYHGELAEAITRDLAANGSFITRDDFNDYTTDRYAPTATTYRDYQVFSNAAPGAGPLLLEALNVLGGLDLGKLEHSGTEHLRYLASTLQLVNQDRIEFLGDPEVIGDGPGNTLMSAERAATLREAVVAGVVGSKTPPAEDPNTTHLNVVDWEGNVVSMTHTLGNSSGVVTPGLGFVYNNGMGRYDPRPGHASSIAPRKARLNLMMPSIAFRDSVPAMALGAPGGNAILSSLTQVFTNVVDYGMTAVEAVSAPRIHAEGATVVCEARVRSDVCDALRERGYDLVQDQAPLSRRMALAQLVIIGPDGELDGASDPRGPMGAFHAG